MRWFISLRYIEVRRDWRSASPEYMDFGVCGLIDDSIERLAQSTRIMYIVAWYRKQETAENGIQYPLILPVRLHLGILLA